MRATWKAAYAEARRTRATGKDLATLICHALGEPAEQGTFWGLTALKLQCCLRDALTTAEPERFRRTRDVLNSFGRLNPWNRFTDTPAKRRDAATVRRIRGALLAKRLIAPEPGGYVTGLLSHRPARLWWHGYERPVAPCNREDLALYGAPWE